MAKEPRPPGRSNRSSRRSSTRDGVAPGARRKGSLLRGADKESASASPSHATSGARSLTTRVETAKGRRLSSTRWLQRQLNDPYVAAARQAGYRSRAAFKLIDLDDRFTLLRGGGGVVDLGAAPGGWTQVAVERAGAGHVVGIDIAEMEAVPGALIEQMDFLEEDAPDRLQAVLPGPVHTVLSDMAAPATGHKPTDHLRIIALCEAALHFARAVLTPGGTFCAKVLQGGTEGALLADMKRDFASVRHAKPSSSRADSSEMYVVALGFQGGQGAQSRQGTDDRHA